MAENADQSKARIRRLNDILRTQGVGGRIFVTRGLKELGNEFMQETVQAMRAFTKFNEENDPYDEHEFGSLDIHGQRVFWKIDYYDSSLKAGSPDPSNPTLTNRVLTIMLANEY